MEAMERAQKLRISTRQLPGRVSLAIEDSGPGVPPHLREKIFEPFFTTKPAGIGTGLGLSVAHTYVMEHHGRISYEQSSLGGACFSVELTTALKTEPELAPARTEPDREPVLA